MRYSITGRSRLIKPPIDKEVKKSYGLEGKFVAFFGGNIGYAQELEFLMELAECYKTIDDTSFS
ncbi:hypothetical protein [Mesotoga sp.]|uniref:hypothetical protein n=1 Tax=Mesotoga sp. TaxID=2053577 RepID=UPI00345E3A0C